MDKLIKAFNDVMANRNAYKVQEIKGHQGLGSYGESQGEYNETFIFYKHKDFPENIFLRETIETDSYGDNEYTASITFVEGKEKTVTIYEPLK